MSIENSETSPAEPELTAADFEPTEQEDEAGPVSASESEQETEAQADPEQAEGEEQPEQDEPDPYAEPPEFWAADNKPLWEKVQDPEVRAAIHEHVREASTAVSRRLEEIATTEKERKAQFDEMTTERGQLRQWLENMAPRMKQAIEGRWANIDWQRMRREDQNLYIQMRGEYEDEMAAYQQVEGARQYEAQQAQQRQAKEFESFKAAEHQKLATALPAYFGPGKAQQTYDELGDYLGKIGFTKDQIDATADSRLIAIAHKSMLYDKAQAALKKGAGKQAPTQTQQATATQTPRRIVPGARTGQPTQSDAVRQAEKRLRSGETLTDDEAGLLFG